MTLLLCLSVSLLLFSAGSKMRQVLQLRVVNYSDYTLSPVKFVLPALDDAFDLTVKPQQSTEYHSASMKFFTSLHLLFGRRSAQGSVDISTDATPAELQGQTIRHEDFIPSVGKYTLVVGTVVGAHGVKKGLALNLNRE
jgi:hypothetical protein